jgi:hypothetical protein
MTELANQITARKARLQRFAEAAARHANKNAAPADIAQVTILERALARHPEMPICPARPRRQYEKQGQPSIYIPITWRILRAVADEFGMTIEEIRSRHQELKYTLPRYVAIGLMLELTQLSLPAIGRQLGGRDHTTIINGKKRLAALLESEAFRNRFDQIKAEIGA